MKIEFGKALPDGTWPDAPISVLSPTIPASANPTFTVSHWLITSKTIVTGLEFQTDPGANVGPVVTSIVAAIPPNTDLGFAGAMGTITVKIYGTTTNPSVMGVQFSEPNQN